MISGLFVAVACAFNALAVTQPNALSGLVFWVKADAGTTTNASGQVTAWADQSGRGNDASAAAANAPDLVVSEPGLNNQPTLRFNGTSQRMSVVNRILTNGIVGCTVIAMAKADVKNNTAIIGIRTAGGTPFVQLDQDSSGNARFIVRNSLNQTATATGLGHTGTNGMYVGRLFKGTDTTWTNRIYFSKASSEGTTGSANFTTSTYLTSADQNIGAVSVGASTFSFWDGDIAEILIYERTLSEVELGQVGDYLSSRYKVSHDGPEVHALKEIPGLSLWLRADACTYEDLFANDPAEHADTALVWSDATTNNHDAVAYDSPTLVTNKINGLPAIAFTLGGRDRFVLRDSPISTDPNQLVVFAVFGESPGDMAQNMLFTHRNTATPLIQASFINGTNAYFQVRGSGGVLRSITVPGLLTNGTFNIVMYQFDVVNDRNAVAVNGGAEVVDTYDFGSQTFIADTQRIGCYDLNGSDDLFLHGYLAELLVYEGAFLTKTQKNTIGYYLERKYGLNTSYVPSGTIILVN